MIKTQLMRKEDFAVSASLKNNKFKFTTVKRMSPSKMNVETLKKTTPEAKPRSVPDPKLKKALNNFDFILQEFIQTPPPEIVSKIPKLQKSKTCCVIESKCIYKRTLSLPNGNPRELMQKTKSLHDLNQGNNAKPLNQNDNVKDVILKFNTMTTSPHNNDRDAILQKNIASTTSESHKVLSRTTSMSFEYNEEKRNSISKIPVNTTLRKSFPSTPMGLNKLDLQIGSNSCKSESEMRSKFSKSVQNLHKTTKMSLMSNTSYKTSNNELSKSVQNLSKSFSTPKSVRNSDMSKSVQNLSKCFNTPRTERNPDIGKSVQNLTKSPKLSLPKSSNLNTTKMSKSINNLSKNYNNYPKTTPPKSPKLNPSELSKSVTNLSKISPKSPTTKTSNLSVWKNVAHSKSIQNLGKITPKISMVKTTMVLSKSTQNLSKIQTNTEVNDKTKRDFVNTTTKTHPPSSENVEVKIEEMKRAFEAKIDQQLKELNIEETDGRNNGRVRSKVEQFSKSVEDEANKDCFVALKYPRDAEIRDIIEKFSGNDDRSKTIKLKKTDTFKKKISVFDALSTTTETDISQKSLKPLQNGDKNIFGVRKHQAEPKFMEKTSKNSERKSRFSKNSLDINLNIKNAEYTGKSLNDKLYNTNYVSDDCASDDSGNISTEIENDGCVSPDELVSVGNENKVFLRNGVLSQLEAQRDECLGGMVVKLQARCRGYLARKRLSQRKLMDLAVRCIQRNVRKFMLVRDWPWWRLLVRVTPLLNVHRTEEKLKIKSEELDHLKVKLEKLIQEKSVLKYENDKLEAKLSEMTADLAEEHSAATIAIERLEAETWERHRLERELSEVQTKNKELNRNTEKLEMELLYAKSDLKGISEEGDDDLENEGVYKQRYERVFRELEFTKRRLRQQHEDDLEQLVGLKKQLEKKLNDAYEEAEEQRQVVGQWKNKVQKLNGEMNDLKLLLEEQNARNNLLEKKQRRFDSETQMLNDELKKEKNAKERTMREKELLMAEKYTIETTLADTRLELELKEEKLNALQREFNEITCGEKTEEEVTNLRRQKIEMERRLQDQEEELDELASQVQLLEQAKLRLEMTVESMRKEAKKEAQLRDDEVEEMRGNAQKRVKALEAQLENEHEERTLLLRQKHELERRLASAADSERHSREGDEILIRRLKNDLRKTKALLRDCQTQLDMQKADAPGKNVIRQLKNQLEDLECAKAFAIKVKQSLESELTETQGQLEESNRLRRDAEEKSNLLAREKSELQSQVEENEEELAEVFKKYKAAIQQMSLDQLALQEQVSLVSELEVERNQLKEQLAELTSRLESAEYMGDASSNLLAKRNEFKVKELESKLDLEQSTRSRLEVQISRLKESVEKLQTEITASKTKEQQALDQIKKLQRTFRETKEELNNAISKELEATQKKKELEKRLENMEAEASSDRNDLKMAKKRIEDLQLALQGELGDSVSDHSESDPVDSDCESVDTYLPNLRASSADNRRFDSLSRSSTSSSNLGKEATFT